MGIACMNSCHQPKLRTLVTFPPKSNVLEQFDESTSYLFFPIKVGRNPFITLTILKEGPPTVLGHILTPK
jgi:hypothetical protein